MGQEEDIKATTLEGLMASEFNTIYSTDILRRRSKLYIVTLP